MKKILLSTVLAFSHLWISASTGNAIEVGKSLVSETNDSTTIALSNDSIPTTDLKEYIVEGKNSWFEGGKAVFVPTKTEKNLARDAASLIDNLGSTLLYVKNGNIMSRTTGEPVTVYINGRPADATDLAIFWPKNVMRVEYMLNTDDPRFTGATNVVNFVMKTYEIGGITKLDGIQYLPNWGIYTASSKMNYKRMSFNAALKGGYSREHQAGSYGHERFSDISYAGVHYDRIDRTQDLRTVNRNDNLSAAFTALYVSSDKFYARHNASFTWDRIPGNSSNGTVAFNPPILSGSNSDGNNKSRNVGVNVNGAYTFVFDNHKKSFAVIWNLAHNHLNSHSDFTEADCEPIITRVKENHNSASLTLRLFWQLNDKIILTSTLTEKRDWYNTLYSGSTGSRQYQQRGNSRINFQLYYTINPRLYLNITPSLSLNDWNINHNIKRTELLPGGTIGSSLTINNSSSARIDVSYYLESPSSASSNDLILRESELMWIAGNPRLRSSDCYSASAGYNTSPLRWLNLDAKVLYRLTRNEAYFSYEPGGEAYEGVIKRYSNSRNRQDLHLNLDASVMLFWGKLRLMGGIEYTHSHITGTSIRHNSFNPELRANCFLGNFNLRALYHFKSRHLLNGGYEIEERPETFTLGATYGNGNLYVDVSISSPFNTHRITKYSFNSKAYSSDRVTWSTGRNVRISLTYTFDYGKKVSPEIDAAITGSGESSVLIGR